MAILNRINPDLQNRYQLWDNDAARYFKESAIDVSGNVNATYFSANSTNPLKLYQNLDGSFKLKGYVNIIADIASARVTLIDLSSLILQSIDSTILSNYQIFQSFASSNQLAMIDIEDTKIVSVDTDLTDTTLGNGDFIVFDTNIYLD